MDQSKGLSALGYLSFFFAPFIVPLILFFVTKEDFIKYHSKRAFISQLIPVVLAIIYIILFFSYAFTWDSTMNADFFFGSAVFIGLIVLALLSFFVAIWNVVQAIKVLR